MPLDLAPRPRRRTPASRTARPCVRLPRQLEHFVVAEACRGLPCWPPTRCRSRRGTCAARPTLACACSMSPMLLAEALGGPAQVHFEHLADVHPRRHAQRVQHDVDRRAVGHVRHVLDRHDLRHHALVAVTAGHLVARLQAALDGQVDLDHLQHARRQLVALRQLLALLFERQVEAVALLRRASSLIASSCARDVVVRQADVEPVVTARTLVEILLVDLRALGELLRAAVGDLADQQLLDPRRRRRPRRCAAGRSGPCGSA